MKTDRSVEGADAATTRDLKAHAERMAARIPVLSAAVDAARGIGDYEAALGALTEAEDDLRETRARLAKRAGR